jgi:predicted nucleic acid-binding protein
VIVDTSVVLDAVERRSTRAAEAVAALPQPSVRSMVVLGELTFGVESLAPDADAAVRARREAALEYYVLISALHAPPTAGQLGTAFGRVSAVAQRAALRIGQNDRWILAEALCWGMPVLTSDATMHQLGTLVVERLDDPIGRALTVALEPPHVA